MFGANVPKGDVMSRLGIRRALIVVTVGASVFVGSTASDAAGSVNGHGLGLTLAAPNACGEQFYDAGVGGVGAVTVGTNVYGPLFAGGAFTHCGGSEFVYVAWFTGFGPRGVFCQGNGTQTTASGAGGIRTTKVAATVTCTRSPGAPFTAHAAETFVWHVFPAPILGAVAGGVVSATLT
jgi:hypothetical protein